MADAHDDAKAVIALVKELVESARQLNERVTAIEKALNRPEKWPFLETKDAGGSRSN